MRIFKFKVFNCENIKFKRKCLIFYYPATSFIIVEIHQTATLFTWTFFIVLLSFANIDETLREPIAILFYDFIVNNFVDRKRTINEQLIYLYPYSMLSPHPPQIHSWLRLLGRRAREQPHDDSWPSRQAREIECTTPAAAIEWAKAASRLPTLSQLTENVNSLLSLIVIL